MYLTMGFAGEVFPAVQENCPTVLLEVELIRRIQSGETDLLPDLLAPHLPRIKSLALAILRDHAEAEDVIQDTALKVMLHLKSIQSTDSFGHWVLQIARNAARTRLRKNRKHLFEPLDRQGDEDEGSCACAVPADPRPGPLASVEEVEMQQALLHAVASLRDNYRKVWELAGAGGSGIAETARKLGITEANAMSRLRRARRKLREILAPMLTQCAVCRRPLHAQEKLKKETDFTLSSAESMENDAAA
ncbi:MAG: RNA polymerase sigma factor [Acidobacteriia bacterium]|nr:RNA polymerase sigma factor [Terriglobia bacterium]